MSRYSLAADRARCNDETSCGQFGLQSAGESDQDELRYAQRGKFIREACDGGRADAEAGGKSDLSVRAFEQVKLSEEAFDAFRRMTAQDAIRQALLRREDHGARRGEIGQLPGRAEAREEVGGFEDGFGWLLVVGH